MRKRGRLAALLLLVPLPAVSQNLLTNPGFDGGLSGWAVATTIYPDPSPLPGYVEASAVWTPSDANGSPASGGIALHARAETSSVATAAVAQCVPVAGDMLASFGARFLITGQYSTADAQVSLKLFPTAGCSGTPEGPGTSASLRGTLPPVETSSDGIWISASSQALTSPVSRSARIDVGVQATGTFAYGGSHVDAVADEAFLTLAPTQTSVSVLPSAAWIDGVARSHWLTFLTLVNPAPTDALVTLQFVPHDTAGEPPRGFSYLVRAGQTLALDEETWELNFNGTYGAIRMTSSSPSVLLQSETTTSVPGGGTVGQAIPALGRADLAGAAGKTLAPIQESSSTRTNLVLANATDAPLTAHVVLHGADGTFLGERDVDLPPLGMTQINRVAAALGGGPLLAGRIAVSTPTPGGLVAAYASVIDNTTNDPRTLLPR